MPCSEYSQNYLYTNFDQTFQNITQVLLSELIMFKLIITEKCARHCGRD